MLLRKTKERKVNLKLSLPSDLPIHDPKIETNGGSQIIV